MYSPYWIVNRRSDLEIVVLPQHVSKRQRFARQTMGGSQFSVVPDTLTNEKSRRQLEMYVRPNMRRALPQELAAKTNKIRIAVDPQSAGSQLLTLPATEKGVVKPDPGSALIRHYMSKPFQIDKVGSGKLEVGPPDGRK